jgi:hypothetical protein
MKSFGLSRAQEVQNILNFATGVKANLGLGPNDGPECGARRPFRS